MSYCCRGVRVDTFASTMQGVFHAWVCACSSASAHGLLLCDTCGNLVDLSLPTAGARQTLVFSYFSLVEECSLPARW